MATEAVVVVKTADSEVVDTFSQFKYDFCNTQRLLKIIVLAIITILNITRDSPNCHKAIPFYPSLVVMNVLAGLTVLAILAVLFCLLYWPYWLY